MNDRGEVSKQLIDFLRGKRRPKLTICLISMINRAHCCVNENEQKVYFAVDNKQNVDYTVSDALIYINNTLMEDGNEIL